MMLHRPPDAAQPCLALALLTLLSMPVAAGVIEGESGWPAFDFRDPATVAAWARSVRHDLGEVRPTPEGMALTVAGPDPYLAGPVVSVPPGVPALLKLRLKVDRGHAFQVFHFEAAGSPTEARSLRFAVAPGDWRDVLLRLPPQPARLRLRLDLPPDAGRCVVERIELVPELKVEKPAWGRPAGVAPGPDAHVIRSGALVLRHAPDRFGVFALELDGQDLARGHDRPWIGHMRDGRPAWIDVATSARVSSRMEGDALSIEARLADEEGATWTLRQRFAPGPDGTIAVRAELSVDADRRILFAPLFLVLPGLGTFGERKGQALFAGLEYLEDEPSSSKADAEGPSHLRRVPEAHKVTFPLMAVQAGGRFVALVWNRSPDVAALFDSPDRTFGSGAHLFGLIAPGPNVVRDSREGLFPVEATSLRAGQVLAAEATLIASAGNSVVPAVQAYVRLRGLPPRPATPEAAEYATLAAHGWLDTPLRDGALFRHALPPQSFPARAAADASWMMRALAELGVDAGLADRLRATAEAAAARVTPGSELFALQGHLQDPVAPLVLGRTRPNLESAREAARRMLRRLGPDRIARYRARPGRPDYGRTHNEDTASGLAAQVVASALRLAAFSGDRVLIAESLEALHALDRFAGGVPRGAQTWEVPLHTPDILASAHLVRAYVLGYELSGDRKLLESARYWAWTGVPFVYLVNPAGGAVGPYATIAVYGATNWEEPTWFGLPVQWCGLEYADALRKLADHDDSGPWTDLAAGIVASGVQQTYPLGEPSQGLLPDSYDLVNQLRRPADINPGTLQMLALEELAGRRAFRLIGLRASGLIVQAPGAIVAVEDRVEGATFTVQPVLGGRVEVLIHGLKSRPRVALDGRAIDLGDRFLPETGTAIVPIEGRTRVEVGR